MSKQDDLMREYFALIREKKQIKADRSAYLTEHGTCVERGDDCIDALRMGEAVDLCEICAKRHNWYLALQRISHRRASILQRVKHILAKEPTNA